MPNQNQPQSYITSQEVVLHFEKEIPDEYRSAFGEYFLGIKDFVKFCYGKNIAMNIEINGSLIIKAFSKNPEDKLLVENAFVNFVNNLNSVFGHAKPSIQTLFEVEIKDLDKTLIILASKMSSLELSIRLSSPLSINTEFEDVKYLVDSVIATTKDLIKDYTKLQSNNLELMNKILSLQKKLQSSQVNNLIIDDKIDTLLSYLSLLKTGLDNQDTSQISSMTSAIKNFWTLNKDKLMLIQISGNTLYQILKTIFKF